MKKNKTKTLKRGKINADGHQSGKIKATILKGIKKVNNRKWKQM